MNDLSFLLTLASAGVLGLDIDDFRHSGIGYDAGRSKLFQSPLLNSSLT